MIRTVLVDDEELARERLRRMLESFDEIEVVAEASDGEEALKMIGEQRPHLVFLDIQMPGMSGLEVAAGIQPPRPRVIFCTAFDRYAIDAFEHHAVDYLLKPVSRSRLNKAVRRVQELLIDQDELTRDLAGAAEVQAHLFPQSCPSLASLDYSGSSRAARAVGGDYYDFLSLGKGRLGIVLGDVSGKGVSAGILMASLQGRFQSWAPLKGEAVTELLSGLNGLIHASGVGKYMTLFYGLYADSDRTLTFANAGHNPPVLLRGNDLIRLETGGLALGMFPRAEYRQETVQLKDSDVLVVYSDGLTETRNASGEEYGEDRLLRAVQSARQLPAQQLSGRILDDVDRFSEGTRPFDDLTLIVAKVKDENI